MKTRSITRRLIGGVLVAELLCVASFAIVATAREMHGRRRAFDVLLRGRTDSLMSAVNVDANSSTNFSLDSKELSPAAEDIYDVEIAGSIVGRSQPAPSRELAKINASNILGYFNFEWNGNVYRALRVQAVRATNKADLGRQGQPMGFLYASPTNHLEHEVTEAVRFYAGTSAFLLIVTGMALVWFLNRCLLPLHELAASARRVSVDSWSFTPPEASLQTRELAPMANSIKKLLRGLQRAFERQRQFTRDAAHELKTSIALLKSRLQLLTMRNRTAEQYAMSAQELLIDIQGIQVLIEQMLALVRIEDAPQVEGESVDLSLVVQSVAQRLQPMAQDKSVSIGVEAEQTCIVSMENGDADILASNLIMNAVQHSHAGTLVTVSVRSYSGGTELRVADTGDGIPEAALPHVFERFYRADVSRSRQDGGTGLGLTICKAIVERAHGKIFIQSKLMEGTNVVATFPSEKL